MDPMRLLETTDPMERAVMVRIANQAYERRLQEDQNRAGLIAAAVGKLFGGK